MWTVNIVEFHWVEIKNNRIKKHLKNKKLKKLYLVTCCELGIMHSLMNELNYFNRLMRFFPVMADAASKPAESAPPTPQLTISCPVKYRFLIGDLGRKNV